jgi:hypothetical protein
VGEFGALHHWDLPWGSTVFRVFLLPGCLEVEALLPERGGGRAAARTAARLRLARGEPSVAVGLLERCLQDHGEPHIHGETLPRAAAALETLVVAYLALDDLAAAAAARIAGLAGAGGHGQVAALAALASAHVAAASGRHDEARRRLERSLALFSDLDLPHETALARLQLARLLAAGNPAMAVWPSSASRTAPPRSPTPPGRSSDPPSAEGCCSSGGTGWWGRSGA